ncbi:MAG: hypothetical protein RTV31_16685 [Candidatus Thorarchaeota archaeon]
MVEYCDEEKPPSCKVTALVLIIVFFLAHEVMTIGIISTLDTSYEVAGVLIAIVLSIAILLPALYWFAKRNERWMKHKFPQDRENEEQEYEERRWY